MEPEQDWDRDEIMERIPWQHLSKAVSAPNIPKWALGVGAVVVLGLVGVVVSARQPSQAAVAQPPQTVAVAQPPQEPVAVPDSTVQAQLLSEADLFAQPPGHGELQAMADTKRYVRSLFDETELYIDWVEVVDVRRSGDRFEVDVAVRLLELSDGAYKQLNPIGLTVAIEDNAVNWSTPIEVAVVMAPERNAGEAKVSDESHAQIENAVKPWGELLEVLESGIEDGMLWAKVSVETQDGVILKVEVWPNR